MGMQKSGGRGGDLGPLCNARSEIGSKGQQSSTPGAELGPLCRTRGEVAGKVSQGGILDEGVGPLFSNRAAEQSSKSSSHPTGDNDIGAEEEMYETVVTPPEESQAKTHVAPPESKRSTSGLLLPESNSNINIVSNSSFNSSHHSFERPACSACWLSRIIPGACHCRSETEPGG